MFKALVPVASVQLSGGIWPFLLPSADLLTSSAQNSTEVLAVSIAMTKFISVQEMIPSPAPS